MIHTQNFLTALLANQQGFLSAALRTSTSHQNSPSQSSAWLSRRASAPATVPVRTVEVEVAEKENVVFQTVSSLLPSSDVVFSSEILPRLLPSPSPQWSGASSYRSQLTFELNKALSPTVVQPGTKEKEKRCLMSALINAPPLLLSPTFLCPISHHQVGGVRYFRADRTSSGLGVRNDPAGRQQSILERLKAKSGLSSTLHDKAKALLDDPKLSLEDQQKLKVAFAEGYLAGNTQNGPGGSQTKGARWMRVAQQFLFVSLFLGIAISLLSSFGGGIFRVQVGSASEVHPEDINVKFSDVRGADEAKQELQDIVEFLKKPEKFSALGGKLPKGVLLVGPPGTGKTLLARAVAGEAEVPFFHAAGPEFDEILVGQGARRVRDLFRAAKQRAPCVVFIDEIDSVGAKRTTSVLHPYANQTINQLLAEMDGFNPNEGVIVLGATNRVDDLDKALIRPGRFDVTVVVSTPDFSGRRDILELYLSKIIAGPDVDLDRLARGTTGFTGADLENIVNQAAVKAAMEDMRVVTQGHLDFARDKVLMGPARKNRLPDEEANVVTAYHEGGHALVAYFTKDSQALHKVTIIPRGQSLGHTSYIPDKERYHVTRSQMLAMLDTLMGGRAAEELVFGQSKITSGAASDLKEATALAQHMVKEWGMSEKVGLRYIPDENGGLVRINGLGAATTELVDQEINRILNESYDRARTLLTSYSKEHHLLAEALMKYETLDVADIKALLGDSPSAPPTKEQDLGQTNPLGGRPKSKGVLGTGEPLHPLPEFPGKKNIL